MTNDPNHLRLPEAARARLEVDRKSRAIATRKLRDVLARAVDTPSIRTIWVHGSYARGAPTVGDIDLMIDIDDARDERQAAWDSYQAYIRGGNPDSEILKALGADGASMIEASVSRNHDEGLGEPLPVDEWELLPDAARRRFVAADPPQLQLRSTRQVVETTMRLLYCRGDDLARASERLASIHEDSTASRFPRTSGIPLLDELASRIGGENQALLETCLRSGGVDIRVHVTEPPALRSLPLVIERTLAERFSERRRSLEGRGPSHRHQMVRALLHALQQAELDLSTVWVFGGPADGPADRNDMRVLVDSGDMVVHRLGERLLADERGEALFDRVVLVLDPSRKSPWIALDFTAADQQALAELVRRQKAQFHARLQNRAWPATADQR